MTDSEASSTDRPSARVDETALICVTCGQPFLPVQRGECSRCGSDAGSKPATDNAGLLAWMETVSKVLGEVSEERVRQQIKWGEQNHPDGTGPGRRWPALFSHTMADSAHIAQLQVDHEAKNGVCTYGGILLEEVFEAMAESDPMKLRAELLQVAAVAVAWVEKIDRDLRTPPRSTRPGGA